MAECWLFIRLLHIVVLLAFGATAIAAYMGLTDNTLVKWGLVSIVVISLASIAYHGYRIAVPGTICPC